MVMESSQLNNTLVALIPIEYYIDKIKHYLFKCQPIFYIHITMQSQVQYMISCLKGINHA